MDNNTKFINYMTLKFPSIKFDITNKKEVKIMLKNLIDKRVIYLIEHGGDNDDNLRNDLELVDLEDMYGIISKEIYYQTKNNNNLV
jgi:hypothetical protein